MTKKIINDLTKRDRAAQFVIENIVKCQNLLQLETAKKLVQNFCALHDPEAQLPFNKWLLNREFELKHDGYTAKQFLLMIKKGKHAQCN